MSRYNVCVRRNMRSNYVKERLAEGACVWGTSLMECLDPEIAYLLKSADLDFFFVDTEHSTTDYAQIQALCRTGRSGGLVPMVRVTENQPHLISRALDVGAMGIIVPRVNTADSARRAVDAAKYPPIGHRGYGPRGIITDMVPSPAQTQVDICNRLTTIVVQVESVEALNAVEEIASVPEIDALFIGPYDLTLSMGIIEQFDNPLFWRAVDRVVAACEKTHIAAGIQTADIGLLQEAQRRGVRFLLYAHDATVLYEGYREAMARLKGPADRVVVEVVPTERPRMKM